MPQFISKFSDGSVSVLNEVISEPFTKILTLSLAVLSVVFIDART